MFYRNFNRFFCDESGAITVDFVILTAAIVGIGLSVIIIVSPGIRNVATGIEPVMQTSEGLAGRLFGTSE